MNWTKIKYFYLYQKIEFCGVKAITDQITDIGIEMCYETSRLAHIGPETKQIWVISIHLKLWVAVARHNFKWVKM